MVSRRRAIKQLTVWDASARGWATDTARSLALDLYHGRPAGARPYRVGVVADPGETVWSEVPVRFNLDWPVPVPGQRLPQCPIRPWLVTSGRVVERLGDGQLYGYRWEKMVGLRVDLTPGAETVAANLDGKPPPVWTGAAVAPLAVAAVFHLHGPAAMIDHPGLAPLRAGPDRRRVPDPQLTYLTSPPPP